jgi:hypothetical protein
VAEAAITMFVPVVIAAPFVGLRMETEGGWFPLVTVRVTAVEVLDKPWVSYAFAVKE